jgi:aryl sulfotransferase
MSVAVEKLKPYRTAIFDNARWADFDPRADDIFVCTPPKCGTTWTQTIVASLMWPDGNFPATVMEFSPWIEAHFMKADAMHAMLREQRHRRVMKTHTPADGIPFFDDAKYLVVARDGRDAFMSWCNHIDRMNKGFIDMLNARASSEGIPELPNWDGDIHGYFPQWLEQGTQFHHVATFWPLRTRRNVLLVHYNDLKTDLASEMRRIAAFLAIDVPEEKWPAVIQRCTFEAMRADDSRVGAFAGFRDGIKGFIHQGTNGRWRDVLTADELALYERTVADALLPDAAAWMTHGRSHLRGTRGV